MKASVVLLLLLCPGGVVAQGQIEEIKSDWNPPPNLRRVRVVGASASTTLDAATGKYLPAMAHDGNRSTKWVASDAPSEKAPQWIDFEFGGDRQVSSVAVFGEAIGNDGIVDAQIQLAGNQAPAWHTVASVTGAKSAAWRATFPVTNAGRARLLITRSGGPSTHTDVYEVAIYGLKPSPEELKDEIHRRIAEAEPWVSNLSQTNWWNRARIAWFEDLSKTAEALTAQFVEAKERVAVWTKLSDREQQTFEDDLDSLVHRLRELKNATAELESPVAAVVAAREQFATASDLVRERTNGNQIELANRFVVVQCNRSNNLWNAFWNGKSDSAIFAAGFGAQADGNTVPPSNFRTEVRAFEDKLGKGKEIAQSWGRGVRVERFLRIYDGSDAITVSGQIENQSSRDVALGSAQFLTVLNGRGQWQSGSMARIPAAVYIAGASEFQCTPGRSVSWERRESAQYSGTQILQLTDPTSRHGLTVGFLTAFEGRPDVSARFVSGRGGRAFYAHESFLNRRLGPGESLDLDTLYLSANDDAYAGLEHYGDAAARFAQQPVRTGPTALWCSWYAHRMAMTEDLVLANAAVAARHLKPLGFEFMQLDHGWQRGDVTGDWVPNERFPHGLKWLSQQLQSRFGLKLGVWIAPTDVAETSATFRDHPDWMLKDAQGKPQVNWRWYWKPNPNCYEVDASNPDAAHWMENVFSHLAAEGVSYYKIDFIAASGGEHFVQQNPKSTRGWSVLRSSMEAVRRGAGTNSWIRYCQPPPLLSAGLASSAYGGDDTSDAGLNGNIGVLRSNARSLAASYWVNDRLYHREVCDMSVRMQAGVEEARMRLAMMTLAGCSISFSDELQYLPASRIRMMQTCLPPGSPPMKPLDLFERTIPSIWHIHCMNDADEWDVVGLFNFENAAEERTVDFARLGVEPGVELAAFEFWEQKFLGVHRQSITVTLPPQSSRILSLRRLRGRPQIIGTDLHQLQGYHELKRQVWDEKTFTLSGECERMPGIEGRVLIYVPSNFSPHFEFPLNTNSAQLTHLKSNLWAREIRFKNTRESWKIPFDRK